MRGVKSFALSRCLVEIRLSLQDLPSGPSLSVIIYLLTDGWELLYPRVKLVQRFDMDEKYASHL